MSESAAPASLPREVVDAFAWGAETALRELMQVEAWAEETAPGAAATEPVVSAVVRLQRTLPGTMSLVVSHATASHLATRYLPAGTALTDEIIADVVGELANVIAGQAKTMLKRTPYHFTLSPPNVISASCSAELPNLWLASPAVSLAFESSCLWLFVELPPCPGA